MASSPVRITTALLVIAALAALESTALSSPAPAKVVLAYEPENGNYLSKIQAPPPEPTFNGRIFNKEISEDLSARYQSIYNHYEARKASGLHAMEDDIRFRDANKSLADWTMHRLLDDHVRRPVRRLVGKQVRDAIRKKKTVASKNKAQEQAVAQARDTKAEPGGAGTDTQSSASLSLREVYQHVEDFYNHGLWLDDDTHMRFQYDMPSGTMDLRFTGGPIDTAFNYYVVPLNFTTTGGFGDNSLGNERAAVSLQKNIVGFGTGAHYGLLTRSLNYGMSRALFGPLSAGINQSHFLDTPAKDETVYRLSLGLSF